MALDIVLPLNPTTSFVQYCILSLLLFTLIYTHYTIVKMDNSTYFPDDEQNCGVTEYTENTEPVYSSYTYAQPSYTYQQTIPYDYNTSNTYTSASLEPQYASTQPALQGMYNPSYNQYEAPGTSYETEYSSYAPVSSSSNMVSEYYQPVSYVPLDSMENPEDTPVVTQHDTSSIPSQLRSSDEHTHKKSSSKTKHSKSSNMRTPRKQNGPPAEFTSIIDLHPDSKTRKTRKPFTEEGKRKVEAVRSIGACGPCRQNKRTVSFQIKDFTVTIKLTNKYSAVPKGPVKGV